MGDSQNWVPWVSGDLSISLSLSRSRIQDLGIMHGFVGGGGVL